MDNPIIPPTLRLAQDRLDISFASLEDMLYDYELPEEHDDTGEE